MTDLIVDSILLMESRNMSKEDKNMANRVELSLEDAGKIAGGDFWYNTYTNEDGSTYMTCRVDGVGTFYCSDNAKKMIVTYYMNNKGVTLEDVINFALNNGYFWN